MPRVLRGKPDKNPKLRIREYDDTGNFGGKTSRRINKYVDFGKEAEEDRRLDKLTARRLRREARNRPPRQATPVQAPAPAPAEEEGPRCGHGKLATEHCPQCAAFLAYEASHGMLVLDQSLAAEGAPRVQRMEPGSVRPAGAVEVTVHGEGFQPGMVVWVGDRLVSEVEVAGDGKSLRFQAPSAPAGSALDLGVGRVDENERVVARGVLREGYSTGGLGSSSVAFMMFCIFA